MLSEKTTGLFDETLHVINWNSFDLILHCALISEACKLKLFKGQCTLAGATSPNSLYQTDLASFKMGAEYDPTDATGFIRLFGLPAKVAAVVNKKTKSIK